MKTQKQRIIEMLLAQIELKIAMAKEAKESAIQSRNSDTKSSAGDKYETTREMMQAEIERYHTQLEKAEQLKTEVLRTNTQKKLHTVAPGAWVETTMGTYFVCIGLGKVQLDDTVVFVISIHSPIGKAMEHKASGDTFQFRNKEISILSIA